MTDPNDSLIPSGIHLIISNQSFLLVIKIKQ